LPEAAEDARFGDANGVGGEMQLGGRLPGAFVFQHEQLKRPPGGGLEFRLEQLQEAAGDMSVVLLIPKPVEAAIGILELVEDVGVAAVPGRQRAGIARAPETAEPVYGDVA